MVQIVHLPSEHRFVLAIEGQEAVLSYRLLDEKGVDSTRSDVTRSDVTRIDFTRTHVPAEFRGKGYAEKLVRRGLSWARDQDYVIQASCWYVEKFLR